MKQSLLKALAALLLTGLFSQSALAEAVHVTMRTNMGVIALELDKEKAPISVENFVNYAKAGFYNGTIFHRVIRNFMIQGGGFDEAMQKKETSAPIQNEAKNGLKNKRGTIAMARTSVPHSATSQFFINHKDNGFLDYPGQDGWGYAVFGKVTDGMKVVDAIANGATMTKNGMRDVPIKNVVIEEVTVSEN